MPSGNVASTCTSCTISAMPSIQSPRLMTCAPADIRSATVRPSRLRPQQQSLLSAQQLQDSSASHLFLSLLRATMAAIDTSNLSFSRGLNFTPSSLYLRPARHVARAVDVSGTTACSPLYGQLGHAGLPALLPACPPNMTPHSAMHHSQPPVRASDTCSASRPAYKIVLNNLAPFPPARAPIISATLSVSRSDSA